MESKRVMFVCRRNSCRSQMAEGFARSFGGGALLATSSGLAASEVNPTAVEVMAELGIDITPQTSKPLADFKADDFDWVIRLCGCGPNLPPEWVTRERFEDWDVADPDGGPINGFRAARDEIKNRGLKLKILSDSGQLSPQA